MRTRAAAGLLLLAGACAVGAGRAPPDAETRQLQQEVRDLKQEIFAARGVKDAAGAARAARPILAKLATEITTGKYKAAAAELLLGSTSVRSSHDGMVNCATVQQAVEDEPGFVDALNDMQGDCGWNALVDLILEVTSGEGTVTGDALKTRVEKACSTEGAASATSCGEQGALAIASRLSRQWFAKDVGACTAGAFQSNVEVGGVVMAGMYAGMICAKDGADYCLATGSYFGAIADGFAEMAQAPTKETLNQQCSKCTLKTIRMLAKVVMFLETPGALFWTRYAALHERIGKMIPPFKQTTYPCFRF